ncbi:MAG: PD40 domain-containing protein [Phycisphaerales bacterium]|nr:PD40 domain-containing protein [Phycisphaerales bacterium]
MMKRYLLSQNCLVAAFALAVSGCASTPAEHAQTQPTGPEPAAQLADTAGPSATGSMDGGAGESGYLSLDEALAPTSDSPTNPPVPFRTDSGLTDFDPWLGLYGEIDGYGGRSTQTAAVENIAQVTFATEGRDAEPDVDKTGEYVAYSSTQHSRSPDIFVKSVSGLTMRRLTDDPASDRMPRFSPDNSQIAFCSNRSGNYDIYLIDAANGGQAVRVTSDAAHEIHPSWSPDGKYLVYSRLGDQSGRWEMWVTEAGNFNSRRFIGYGLCPEWNPDPASNLIAFQSPRERGSRLFGIWTIEFVDGEGTRPTEIVSAANAAAINPSWSPDGKMLTFTTITEPGQPGGNAAHTGAWADIWVVNLDGSSRVNLTNGEYANIEPTWSPDGRILFVSNRSGVNNIWAIGPDRAIQTARGPSSVNANSGVVGVDTGP